MSHRRKIKTRKHRFSLASSSDVAKVDPNPARIVLMVWNNSNADARWTFGDDPDNKQDPVLYCQSADELYDNTAQWRCVGDVNATYPLEIVAVEFLEVD